MICGLPIWAYTSYVIYIDDESRIPRYILSNEHGHESLIIPSITISQLSQSASARGPGSHVSTEINQRHSLRARLHHQTLTWDRFRSTNLRPSQPQARLPESRSLLLSQVGLVVQPTQHSSSLLTPFCPQPNLDQRAGSV